MDARKYHLAMRLVEVVEKVLLQTPNHTDSETAGIPPISPSSSPAAPKQPAQTDGFVPDSFEAMLTSEMNRHLQEEPRNTPVEPQHGGDGGEPEVDP